MKRDEDVIAKKSFYFMRHGETDYNRQRLCTGGKTDISLNETGRAQALKLKQKLNGLSFTQVICSPLLRARQTVEFALGVTPLIDNDLREIELGDLEGRPVQEFVDAIGALPRDEPLPHGESRAHFFDRTLRALNTNLDVYGENLLVVAHGGTYRVILEALQMPQQRTENTKLVYFRYEALTGWEQRIV